MNVIWLFFCIFVSIRVRTYKGVTNMIITNEAAAYILEMMRENEISVLRFTYEGPGEKGPLWGITLDQPEEGDVIKEINGVSVAIAKEVVEVAEQVKLAYDEAEGVGSLVIEGIE